MKQVIAEAGNVKVVEVPVPACKDNEVLVKSEYSLISTGTENFTLEATNPIGTLSLVEDSTKLRKAVKLVSDVVRKEGVSGLVDYVKAVRNPEVALGYSVSGTIVRIGKNVTDLTTGDRVACAGEGFACHAEYIAVPRNLLARVPDGVNMKDAAFTTLGAIAVHGFRQSSSALGETVAVIGAGLVGNLVIQACRAAGCNVVALDVKQERLDLATKMGAGLALNTRDPNVLDQVSHFTRGRGVDSVIVCASSQSSDPVNLASRLARDRAKVTIVGRVGMEFDRKDYYQKELSISMSRSLGPGRYDSKYEEQGVDYPVGYVRWTLRRNMEAFLDLLAKGAISVGDLVEGEYPVDKAPEAYRALDESSRVAMLIQYPVEITREETYEARAETQQVSKGTIKVAFIGPGNFGTETLLPLLRSDKRFALRWVVASDPLHARQVANRYHFDRFGTNLEDTLEDPETDLVIISTPNFMHAKMTIKSARAGKAVFVEKPLCITHEELDEIINARKETGSRIIVGFNRRYAPLVLAIKERLSRLNGPFLINYRANTDLIPATRWSQDPSLGGGRVIHEACHFFDLFNFLLPVGEPQVSVTATDVNYSTVVARDNFVATLKYPDGSVAALTYSALGTRALERERMEIFAQGSAFVLDDYRTLGIYGKDRKFIRLRHLDKGHKKELDEVYKALTSGLSNVITFDETVRAMEITFTVDEKLRQLEVQRENT